MSLIEILSTLSDNVAESFSKNDNSGQNSSAGNCTNVNLIKVDANAIGEASIVGTGVKVLTQKLNNVQPPSTTHTPRASTTRSRANPQKSFIEKLFG
ncbi:MAG: hypothetical protein FWC91_01360 [Defluviitaleaceae bacterium]|nr:hypothetical protein [Defluviitaleaceae bacterium]